MRWNTILVVSGVVGLMSSAAAIEDPAPATPGGPEEFSIEVQTVLEQRTKRLTETLIADPVVQQAVRESNERNKALPLSEILRLDVKWQATEGTDDFIKRFLTNACAERLLAFQEAYEGFSEIFIADARGLVVAETNKTSDYYQADEAWWVKAYDAGRGHTFHGDIEYDQSAMAEAIAVYVPVMDAQTHHAIGVLKAIVDLTSIKREL